MQRNYKITKIGYETIELLSLSFKLALLNTNVSFLGKRKVITLFKHIPIQLLRILHVIFVNTKCLMLYNAINLVKMLMKASYCEKGHIILRYYLKLDLPWVKMKSNNNIRAHFNTMHVLKPSVECCMIINSLVFYESIILSKRSLNLALENKKSSALAETEKE